MPSDFVKVDVWSAGVIPDALWQKPFGEDLSQDMILSQQTILKVRAVHDAVLLLRRRTGCSDALLVSCCCLRLSW